MFLSEILEQLSFGELSQLHIGGASQGGVTKENYPQVISYINLGLTEIYKRFPLKRKSVIVQVYADINEYPLQYIYAQTNTTSTEPVKFILDTAQNTFLADVLLIEQVLTTDKVDLHINELNNDRSVYTPTYDTILLESPENGDSLTKHYSDRLEIKYRAYPDKINKNVSDTTTVYVHLPEFLLEALLSYVAHRAYIGLPTPEPANSATAYTRFSAACSKIEDLGLIIKQTTYNNKLDNSGFV